MDVRNCRNCKRLFNYLGGQNICPECRDKLDKKFLEVRDYIRENPTHAIQQVADATEVNVQQVRDWIKEGRLELSKGSAISASCEKCGAPVYKGRYCPKCSEKMANSLTNLIRGEEEKKRPKRTLDTGDSGPRMRFRKMD